MDVEEVRLKIKQGVSNATGISLEDIPDSASFKEDLGLDSLSIFEITVNIEYLFKIKLPEKELPEIRTVQDAVEMVCQYLPVEQT